MIGSRSAARRAWRGSLPVVGQPLVYVFGPYRLDTVRELLRSGNRVVPLPRRPFVILRALIEADGRIVSREALTSLIWSDGAKAGRNLNQYIYMLRQLLGESAKDHQFVLTIHGKGLRFGAPVAPAIGGDGNASRDCCGRRIVEGGFVSLTAVESALVYESEDP